MASPPASPRGAVVATRPKLVDLASMIPLQEAKDDSPLFKAKLKISEEALEEVVNVVKRVVKSLKTVTTDGHAYGTAFNQLTAEVQQLAAFESEVLGRFEPQNGVGTQPPGSSSPKATGRAPAASVSVAQRAKTAARNASASISATLRPKFISEDRASGSASPSMNPLNQQQYESTRLFQEEMENFGHTLAELERLRQAMFDQMDIVIAGPLEQFYTQDVPQARDLSRQFHRTDAAFQAAATKFSQVKKTSSHFNETEIEWREAKRAHRRTSMEYAAHLNRLLPRKKMDLLERFTELMMMQKQYFAQGYEVMRDLEPRLQRLADTLQHERRFLDENDRKIKELIETLAAAPDDFSVPEEVNLIPSSSISSSSPNISSSHQQDSPVVPVGITVPTTSNSSGAVTGNSATETEIQGYLFKRNRTSTWQEWKRGFFAVKEGQLHYYSKDKSQRPDDSIDLLLCTIRPVPPTGPETGGRENCFEIISPYKSFTLQAEDRDVVTKWIQVIQSNVALKLAAQSQQQIANTPKPNLRGNTNTNNNNTSSSSSPASSSAGTSELSEADKRERLRILEQLHTMDPKNAVCADCGTENPTWSVINIGVLVCIECSGIHRSLGTHISKVRSVALDRVDNETIHMLQIIGNSCANSILEGSIPSSSKKPAGSTATRAEREKFIRAKYADRAFVKPYRGVSLAQDFLTAVKNQDLTSAFTLLLQGADINCLDAVDNKKSALHHAAFNGDIAMMELLLLNGANPNIVDETPNAWMPIHYCAVGNHTIHAALLFKRGAKIDAKDSRGRTAVDLAVHAQHADCVTLLRLAQYTAEEKAARGNTEDHSFAEALSAFSLDLSKSAATAAKATKASSSSSSSSSSSNRSSPLSSSRKSKDRDRNTDKLNASANKDKS